MRTLDSVVIGAGPAGLSAAAELSAHGDCLLLDEGAPAAQRDRHDPHDLLAGIGGAGLFSDGKHSFYPAATALWALPDREALAGAFAATAALLRDFAVDAGPLPEPTPDAIAPGGWQPKRYPSIYLPLCDRLAIIERLAAASAPRTHARVIDARRDGDTIVVALDDETVRARRLIVAGGRWAARAMRPWLSTLGARYAFSRVELGVRLELPATAPLFAALPGVDGKLRFVDDEAQIEIRTFCTCRNGEVLRGEAGGLRAFSGRADGPPTGRSNVGLVVRSRDPRVGDAVMRALAAGATASFPIDDGSVDRLTPIVGEVGARLLDRALGHLWAFADLTGATVHAPAIEGVGDYPVDDGDLRIAPGVWIAGDAGGRFRGIVAAMISGRYAARRLRRTSP